MRNLKLNLECTLLTSDICNHFVASRPYGLEKYDQSRSVFTRGKHYKTYKTYKTTRPQEKYFPLFPFKAANNCMVFPVGNLNVELTKHSIYGGWGSGRVGSDFLLAIAGRVGSAFRLVGSGPRKVTRGQFCSILSYRVPWVLDSNKPNYLLILVQTYILSYFDSFY